MRLKGLITISTVVSILIGCSQSDIAKDRVDLVTNTLTEGMDKKYTTLSPTNIDIPDNGVVTLYLNIKDSKIINKLTIMVYAKHPRISDLNLYLVSPSGTSVTLMEAQGDNQELKESIGFRDDIVYNIDSFTSSKIVYKPKEPLESFYTENSKGEWKLFIEDSKSGNIGQVSGFSLWFDWR